MKIIIFSLLALFVSFPIHAKETDFEYQNCADQSFGPALLECAKIIVGKSLDAVQIRDVGEEGLSSSKGPYFSINSTRLPLAIPTEAYASKDSWVFAGKKYIKIKKNIHAKLPVESTVDVIAIIDHIDSIKNIDKINDLKNIDVLNNVILTFWYSPSTGVTAISFPTQTQSGEVFFCTRHPCIFQVN